MVDWSYGLLSNPERQVFERLSVFIGGCSMAAARAVCTDDAISTEDVADIVTRLADKSLVTIEEDELAGHARCRMLQTLAEYGRERLVASGDEARVRAAHAAYYAGLAVWSMAALRGESQRSWIRVVSANLGRLAVGSR